MNSEVVLSVEDNGRGLDREIFNQSDTLGRSTIDSLCRQLDAELDITVDSGTCFTIKFEKGSKKGSHANIN